MPPESSKKKAAAGKSKPKAPRKARKTTAAKSSTDAAPQAKRKKATRTNKTSKTTKAAPKAPKTDSEPKKPARPATRKKRTTKPKNPWTALGLNEEIVQRLGELSFETPSDIQRELIPVALTGKDCLGQARTGTGKTAAFTLPLLQLIERGAGPQAIILAPTRELAAQVDDHVRNLGKGMGFKTAVILGGRRMGAQLDALKRKPELIIGTPGRILDLMHRKHLHIRDLRFAVLDEVDRMLDIGFRDDIRRILRAIEAKHQTIFVSATLDEEIEKLAKTFMHDPVEVNVSHDMLTVDNIHAGFVSVHAEDKFNTLVGFLKHEAPTLAIVFTNTKIKARRVADGLRREGVSCKEIHGDLMQSRRERVMSSFRNQKIQVLVATDLASRGLDVMDISHIVNYDIPEDSSAYVHRIGRTARMGKTGYAVTFVTREQGKQLTEIEMLINKQLPQFDPQWLVKREPSPEEIAEATAHEKKAPVDVDPPVSTRLKEAARKDETLEEHGLRPIRRTLGSRFRSGRKFRR